MSEYAHGGQEWVMPNLVQEVLPLVNDPDNDLWAFKRVISHQKQGNKMMLQVEWDNDKIAWELLSLLRKSDPITIAQYADERNLPAQQIWTWTRKIVKTQRSF